MTIAGFVLPPSSLDNPESSQTFNTGLVITDIKAQIFMKAPKGYRLSLWTLMLYFGPSHFMKKQTLTVSKISDGFEN